MSRLECAKCRSIYADVVRVRKCPLCGCMEVRDAEPQMGTAIRHFPRWFTWQGNIGFFYLQTMRTDDAAGL